MIQRITSNKPDIELKPFRPYRQQTNFHSLNSRDISTKEKAKEISRAPRNSGELSEIREVLIANLKDPDLSGAIGQLTNTQKTFLEDEAILTPNGKFDRDFVLSFRRNTLALPVK